jgi:hypothetical protein
MSALRSPDHGSPLEAPWALALLVAAAGLGILLAAAADSSDPRSVEQALSLREAPPADTKLP